MITAINKIKGRNKTYARIGEAKSKLCANNRPFSALSLIKDLQVWIF